MAGGLTIIFLIFFCRHLAFAIAAARWAESDLLAADVELDGFTPSVAVLVGCKNEELVVDGMVRALLSLDYPADKLRIVVVDDGSTDATGAKLDAWAAVDPRLAILHRPDGAGGGKSGALNDALGLVEAEIAVVFDADHEPARNVIRRLVRHFRDPEVGCVMGRCIVRNGEESPLAGIIFIDFLSGYLVNEYGRQALFELPAYGGANCAVRMSTLKELGGWNPHTVTEDTDLTLRVLLSGKRVRFDPTAVDFEEAVVSARRFWNQRYRWARGHQKCMRDYWRPMMTSPHLSLIEKFESAMFLFVYHIPVLCGLGVRPHRAQGGRHRRQAGRRPAAAVDAAVRRAAHRAGRRPAARPGRAPHRVVPDRLSAQLRPVHRDHHPRLLRRHARAARTAGSRRPAPGRPPPRPRARQVGRPPTSPWPCWAPPGDGTPGPGAGRGRESAVAHRRPPASDRAPLPAGGSARPPAASPATGPQIDRPCDKPPAAGHTQRPTAP